MKCIKKSELIIPFKTKKTDLNRSFLFMVPEAGFEPARACTRGILSPLCLPIPPLRRFEFYGGDTRI